MRERPILFQGAMVRALLAGTKTQTRRVMQHQPHDEATVVVERFNQTVIDRRGDEQPGPEVFGAWWADGECGAKCPYGQPGDRLWVRETWRGIVNIAPPGSYKYAVARYVPAREYCRRVEYAATQQRDSEPWRPSIHMPRWAG
jgi:hypothetical protein